MKKFILVVFITLTASFSGYSQFETAPADSSNNAKIEKEVAKANRKNGKKTPLQDKIVVGGGLDLRFGDYTVIGVTPLIGYSVTDDFLVGGIFTYRYFKDNFINYSTSTYGISPFARYNVFRGLFVHVEYEMLYGQFYFNDDPRWVNSLLVGGGYGFPVGDRGFVGAYILWNVTPDSDPNYQIYDVPVLRMSFGVGF